MNNKAPEYLREKFKSNRELGLRRTQGFDKLHLKSVKTVRKEIFRVSSSMGLEQPSRRYQKDKIGIYFQKTLEIAFFKSLL